VRDALLAWLAERGPMKTRPSRPARIDFGAEPGSAPLAPLTAMSTTRASAPRQARHVFLPATACRRAGPAGRDFVVAETGFGLGNNFLATWAAWRATGPRCARLHYVALELHPPTLADLRRAHAHTDWPELAAQLVRAWPRPRANLHPLDFEDGRCACCWRWATWPRCCPPCGCSADAIYLDGFAPARNPQMWEPRC
jgi:tRNA 5-methylaminomethyl-2-thiouridine biosynthesis bifunctional protein